MEWAPKGDLSTVLEEEYKEFRRRNSQRYIHDVVLSRELTYKVVTQVWTCFWFVLFYFFFCIYFLLLLFSLTKMSSSVIPVWRVGSYPLCLSLQTFQKALKLCTHTQGTHTLTQHPLTPTSTPPHKLIFTPRTPIYDDWPFKLKYLILFNFKRGCRIVNIYYSVRSVRSGWD